MAEFNVYNETHIFSRNGRSFEYNQNVFYDDADEVVKCTFNITEWPFKGESKVKSTEQKLDPGIIRKLRESDVYKSIFENDFDNFDVESFAARKRVEFEKLLEKAVDKVEDIRKPVQRITFDLDREVTYVKEGSVEENRVTEQGEYRGGEYSVTVQYDVDDDGKIFGNAIIHANYRSLPEGISKLESPGGVYNKDFEEIDEVIDEVVEILKGNIDKAIERRDELDG